MLSHCTNDYWNAPQSCVIRTLLVLFIRMAEYHVVYKHTSLTGISALKYFLKTRDSYLTEFNLMQLIEQK